MFTKTAEKADVVFPSAASWCESEGTVTNSERRVQRVRKALEPPGEARDDIVDPGRARAPARATTGATPTAEHVWDELRSLSPMHAGMSYARLEEHGGLQWPCLNEEHPGLAVPARPALGAPARRASGAVFGRRGASRPFESLDADYPIRLTTGRRLESYNTGAQSNLYSSPLHRGESLDLSPEDAERLELRMVRSRASRPGAVRSRRRCASTRRCAPASRS